MHNKWAHKRTNKDISKSDICKEDNETVKRDGGQLEVRGAAHLDRVVREARIPPHKELWEVFQAQRAAKARAPRWE